MNYEFKKAYDYAKDASIEDLFKRSVVYNSYITFMNRDGRAPVAHDIMLTIIGSIFGPYGNLKEEAKCEINKYLEFTDRGFVNCGWWNKTLEWFDSKTKTQEDVYYFIEMGNILNRKSDDVYRLLCENSNISSEELLGMIPFPNSRQLEYYNWMFV